nr:MAG TPA: hypothetical protein [Caudoviricetes sp.]
MPDGALVNKPGVNEIFVSRYILKLPVATTHWRL